MNLVLWDVDGTLLKSDAAGAELFFAAFGAVYGLRDTKTVKMSGNTDLYNFKQLCLVNCVAFSEEKWREMQREVLSRLSGTPFHVLPNARESLESLAASPTVRQAVLTGNFRERAHAVLQAAGLASFFTVGAYGNESEKREDLARNAIARSEKEFGVKFSRVFVIGDAVNDIRCAHSVGASAISVATGLTPKETLAAEKPEFLFDALPSPAHLREIVGC